MSGLIPTDREECPDFFISVLDPYSVDMGTRKPNQSSLVAKEWVVCPTMNGETTVFQSFLNVIKIIEKTGHTWNNFLVFEANYVVTKDTNLAVKMSFIKSHFEGAACTEVRIFRIQK